MFLAAMLALSGLLAVATATDKVEAKTSYSGGSKYKHYNYPKKHYEPKHEKNDYYDKPEYKGDYHKDDYYQGEYQPYYETYEPDYDPSYTGPKHYKTKTFRLYVVSPGSDATVCGETAGEVVCVANPAVGNGDIASASITRTLYLDPEGSRAVATLYQVGSAAKAGFQNSGPVADQARFIWQQSFRFLDGSGTIQTQGDDSGWENPKYSNRAIIGGTGRYAGVTGYLTRTTSNKDNDYVPEDWFEFVLTNWNGYGYGY